ncbi:sigma-70 family RNA polymerase sigma factor [Candidatus Gracilibacteria bacterium]|nr:sigma-70 family RNA polymerase sigma factor [Candidatus Gracilibacteria bacterium]
MIDESKIIIACKEGDHEQFALLYDAYVQKIYGFIFHKTFHRETAEDLTSETFLKALEKISTYNPKKASFSTWIFAIARNTVIDHYRTFKSESDIEDVWDIASSDDVEMQADARLAYERLQKHLQSFTTEQREILTLRFWQDMSYVEISEVLGKSEASVKMAASRGIAKLKKEFFLFLFFSTFFSL